MPGHNADERDAGSCKLRVPGTILQSAWPSPASSSRFCCDDASQACTHHMVLLSSCHNALLGGHELRLEAPREMTMHLLPVSPGPSVLPIPTATAPPNLPQRWYCASSLLPFLPAPHLLAAHPHFSSLEFVAFVPRGYTHVIQSGPVWDCYTQMRTGRPKPQLFDS